jgi:hypothetical protein
MFSEIKKYDLRFIIDRDVNLKMYGSVSLSQEPPTKPEDYYWVEKVEHTPRGFYYRVSGVDKQFHEGELYPLLPLLVSKEPLELGDKFYCEGEVHDVYNMYFDDKLDSWMICSYNGFTYHEAECHKVIADFKQFGWFYNEGPPHDHNYNWRDSRYLETYINTCLIDAVKEGFKMTIMVEEICPNYNGAHVGKDCSCKSGFKLVPKLHEGKIIIDQYGLLEKSQNCYKY